MELTVGKLKEIIKDLPDDAVLADLDYGNDEFHPHIGVKRVLILKDESQTKKWGGRTFVTINRMGSHFTKEGDQKYLEFTGLSFS